MILHGLPYGDASFDDGRISPGVVENLHVKHRKELGAAQSTAEKYRAEIARLRALLIAAGHDPGAAAFSGEWEAERLRGLCLAHGISSASFADDDMSDASIEAESNEIAARLGWKLKGGKPVELAPTGDPELDEIRAENDAFAARYPGLIRRKGKRKGA